MKLPALARLLVRVSPVPAAARDEVHTDLVELFERRRRAGGFMHAQWRLYRDIASLWRTQKSEIQIMHSRSMFAVLRDVPVDLRYAVRLFARQPIILLLTIGGLALGLGIATSAFSIVNAAALRGEGLADSNRVPGAIRTTDRSTSTTWTLEEFRHLRAGATRIQLEAVVSDAAQVRVTESDGEIEPVDLAFVSEGFFAATGGRAATGRVFGPADDAATGMAPVVVSHVFWTSRLNQDASAIGRTIRVGRIDATIIGIASPEFRVPGNRRLWMPMSAYGAVYGGRQGWPENGLQVFGRLAPDATLSDAQAQLSSAAGVLPRTIAGDSAVRVTLDPNEGLGRASAADTLTVAGFVFAVIGLVLVLACANVATVLVSAAITREREMGVRAALGAGRGRIVRQLVTESLALGSVAAVFGLLLAYWAIPVIGRMIDAPAGTDLKPDVIVYLFLVIVTIVTSVVAGLAPARHGKGVDLVSPLKGEAGQNRLAPRRLRSALVIAQAAASVLLIVMATLFVRATFKAAAIDVGFEPAGLYAVSPGLGSPFTGDGSAIRNFWPRAMAELRTVPGVQAFSLAEPSPFSGLTKTWAPNDGSGRIVNLYGTDAGYFDALGLRMLAGRPYTSEEVRSRAPVAVISESFARAFFPDRSPLGEFVPRGSTAPQLVILGVVSDAITVNLHDRATLAVYQPLEPESERYAQLLIRVAPGSTGVADQAKKRLRAIDADADVTLASIDALVQEEAGRPRILAALAGVIGLIAIVLCAIGLYGLTASVVGQRSREMAVRAAIGADRGNLLRLLMWDSLRPVVIGLVLGSVAALLAGQVLGAAVFFGVSPSDPLAFAGAAAILLAAAMLAVLVPTRRASAINAALVLRG